MFTTVVMPIEPSREVTWARALPAALRLLDGGGTLHVITVVPAMQTAMMGDFFPADFEQRALDAAGTRLREAVGSMETGGTTLHPHVLHGQIAREIIDAAARLDAQAIVMASHRPGLSDWLIGANALRVVQHAPQSVFVIRD